MDLAGGVVQLQVLPGGFFTQGACREVGGTDQKATDRVLRGVFTAESKQRWLI